MKMLTTNSPAISALGYNGRWQLLDVTFQNGKTYRYRGVSKEIYEQMKDGHRVGRLYNQLVRGQFPSKQVA